MMMYLFVALTLLVTPAAWAAPEPTLSDIAGCNEQAAKVTGAPVGPRPKDRAEDPLPPGASTAVPGRGAPGERTDPSGSVVTETPDPLVKGMDASRVDDPHYRAAYRDCMRARLEAR